MTKYSGATKDLSLLRAATMAVAAIQVLSFLLLTWSGVGGAPSILSSYFVGSVLVILLLGLLPVGLGLALWLWRREFWARGVGVVYVALLGSEVIYLVEAAIVNLD